MKAFILGKNLDSPGLKGSVKLFLAGVVFRKDIAAIN